MITTTTIERLCLDLELHCPDADRREEHATWLEDQLDAGRYGLVEVHFAEVGGQPMGVAERMQLACEAIKFLRLRLAGFDLHAAMDRMIGLAA